MAVENLVATGAASTTPSATHGLSGTVKGFSRTVEVTAAATEASTYDFGYLPADAQILGASTYSIDDNDTGSTSTIDFGLFPVSGNITADDDALNDGIVMGTAATKQPLIKDIANYGKKAWQLVNGQTVNPGGRLLLRGTLKDAAVSAGGTVTVEVYYLVP